MPRFFFDLSDARGLHRDEVGDDLADLEEAREQCQGMLADLIGEGLPGGDRHEIHCDVRDDTGRTVYRAEIAFEGTRDPEEE